MRALTGADGSRPPTVWVRSCSCTIRRCTAHDQAYGGGQVLARGQGRGLVRSEAFLGLRRTVLLPLMPTWHLPGWAAGVRSQS